MCWISLETDPPEIGQLVDVWGHHEKEWFPFMEYECRRLELAKGHPYFYKDNNTIERRRLKVTHWMPAPTSPPDAGGEGWVKNGDEIPVIGKAFRVWAVGDGKNPWMAEAEYGKFQGEYRFLTIAGEPFENLGRTVTHWRYPPAPPEGM